MEHAWMHYRNTWVHALPMCRTHLPVLHDHCMCMRMCMRCVGVGVGVWFVRYSCIYACAHLLCVAPLKIFAYCLLHKKKNRYASPLTEECVAQMKADGVTRAVAFSQVLFVLFQFRQDVYKCIHTQRCVLVRIYTHSFIYIYVYLYIYICT